MANMFAAHPLVYVPLRETRAFEEPAKVGLLWNKVLEEARSHGRRFIVEKTPRHLHHLDLIRATVPGAKFIVMVRDGRDVAYSFIRRVGSAKVGANRWLKENKIVIRESSSPDVRLVRYENLVKNTEKVLVKACAFVGVPYDEAMLNYHAQERLWFGQGEVRNAEGDTLGGHLAHRNWQINQPVFDGRGQWRGKLADTDLEPFRTPRGRKLMLRLGYDPDE